MWLGFFLTIATGVLWGAIGVLNSKVSRRKLDFAAYAATGVLLSGAGMWTAYIDYPALRQCPPYTWHILVICSVAGVIAGFGYASLQRAMSCGHHGAVWTVSQSAMVLPLLTALIGWNEALSPAGMIGMLLLIIALLVFGFSNHEEESLAEAETRGPRWFWFALLAFLLFGASQSLNSIPSLQRWPDPARLRPPAYSVGQCVFYVTWMLARRSHFRKAETLLAIRYALYGGVSMMMIYVAMDRLAAVKLAGVTFPVSVGTCIVVFALYSVLWLKEKSGLGVVTGMALAAAGIGCLILRGLGW